MNKNLRIRTDGEELWLWRQRENLKQSTAAKRLHCGRTTYWKMETDQQPAPVMPVTAKPTAALLLKLARRRLGLGLRGTAESLSCSHVVLLRREAEADAGLLAWWKKRGFVFA